MTTPQRLVCVFLSGGTDGLNLVVPHSDDRYYALRPTLGVPRPDDTRVEIEARAIDLDGRFGLHPALSALAPVYRAGELAIIHAVGSDDQTRSHFEATDRMDQAGPKDGGVAGGWLARHLATRPGARPSALGAIAFGTAAPESLRGIAASVFTDASEFRLGGARDDALVAALNALYDGDIPWAQRELPLEQALRDAGKETLATVAELERIDAETPSATLGKLGYPDGPLGKGLAQAARLLRMGPRLGVEVVTIDHGNWDTHFVQGQIFPDLASKLGDALAAFRRDLGDAIEDVTVVVMSEFGRRTYENASLGTDHGRGGVMLVMGGRVRGGRVVTEWPGLAEEQLEPPGDLRVTIDYRDVLSEIVEHALDNPRAAEVLPGWSATRRGIIRA